MLLAQNGKETIAPAPFVQSALSHLTLTLWDGNKYLQEVTRLVSRVLKDVRLSSWSGDSPGEC